MKDIMLKITGRQFEGNKPQDKMEFVTEGKMYERGGALPVIPLSFGIWGMQSDGTLTDGFRGDNLKQAAFTFLYRDLMIFLFALLLVIPGIIKMYEFYFVAPLTVDHPELSAVEIGDLSKGMTKGRKMELFMLDLSFILWNIASTLTAGLVGIFYYYPYRYQVKALAYRELVLDGADPTRPAKD